MSAVRKQLDKRSGRLVQATSVDDFVASLPGSSSRSFMIDILKIDTEGTQLQMEPT